MSALDKFRQKKNLSGGVKSSSGSALERFKRERVAPTSTPTRKPPVIKPVDIEVAQPAKPLTGFVGKSLNFIDRLTQRPELSLEDQERMSKQSSFRNTLKYFPSTFIETLLPPVGAIRNDPVSASQITIKDLVRETPGAIVGTAKSIAKAPIKGAVEVPNFATGGLYQPEIKFNVPLLGEVTNSDYNIAQRVANGEDPTSVVIGEKSTALLDILFFASLASKAVTPRPRTISSQTPFIEGALPTGAKLPPTHKSFRLSVPPKVINQTLPPSFVEELAKRGLDMKPYNPKNPIVYQVTTKGGVPHIKLIEIRPSYFKLLQTKLASGKPIPDSYGNVIHESTRSISEIKNTVAQQTPVVPPAVIPKSSGLTTAQKEAAVAEFNTTDVAPEKSRSQQIKEELLSDTEIPGQNALDEALRAEDAKSPPPNFAPKGQTLKKVFAPVKRLSPEEQASYTEWKRNENLSRLDAQDIFEQYKSPTPPKVEDLYAYQRGVRDGRTSAIEKEFNELFKTAAEDGLQIPYKQNYLPQIYKQSPDEVIEAVKKYLIDKGTDPKLVDDYVEGRKNLSDKTAISLRMTPNFTKSAAFPDYTVAKKYGLDPLYNDMAQLLAYYKGELGKTRGNKQFLEELIRQGRVKTSENAPQSWKEINISARGERFYASKDLADVVNGQFRDMADLGFGEQIAHRAAQLSKGLQEVKLSAGIPGTSFNIFTVGQVLKGMTSGDFSGPVGAFIRSNSNKVSRQYFKDHADVIREMADNGIDLGKMVGGYKDVYKTLTQSAKDGRGLGLFSDAFGKAFNEKTFNSFMPQMIIESYMKTKAGLVKGSLFKGRKDAMPEKEAQALAAETTSTFMGLIKDTGRSGLTHDVMAGTLFAPRFREGIVNTVVNAVRGSTTQFKNPAFSKSRKFMLGVILTYFFANLLNKKLNGHWMYENPEWRKTSVQIPKPSGDGAVFADWMPTFTGFPKAIVSGAGNIAIGNVSEGVQSLKMAMSMPVSIAGELFTNKNFFGNPIWDEDATKGKKTAQIIFYLNDSVMHPFAAEPIRLLDESDNTTIDNSIAHMLELPLKFKTQQALDDAEYYKLLEEKMDEKVKQESKMKKLFKKNKKVSKEEAQANVDALTDDQYKIYREVVEAEKFRKEDKIVQDMYSLLVKNQKGSQAEAQKVVDALSDEEYDAYKKAIKFQKRNKKASDGEIIGYDYGEMDYERNVIKRVLLYAKAFGIDPEQAWKGAWGNENIEKVDGDLVMFYRMPFSRSEMEAYKQLEEQGIAPYFRSEYRLDHTIPRELGGDNSPENLRLVPKYIWAMYTDFENALSAKLRAGKVTRKKAGELIEAFKNGAYTAEEFTDIIDNL